MSATPQPLTSAVDAASHPRLAALVARAVAQSARQGLPRLALAYPGDALALDAAQRMQACGLARPVLVGPPELLARAADAAGVALDDFETQATPDSPAAAASAAVALARQGVVQAVMKGSLHSDELLRAVVHRRDGLMTGTRISHTFVFDLPRYPKLLALADCVVNIAPHLRVKALILEHALALLQRIGPAQPRVGIVAAVEVVTPDIPATQDAQALVQMHRAGRWPQALIEGPFGLDNALSAKAAQIKGLTSQVAGQADLLLMPDLNAGNLLYKSFIYIGGGECAGLVLGTQVPVVLTSRADSVASRMASVALAVLAGARP